MFTSDEKKELRHAFQGLDLFKQMHNDMPVQYIMLLLAVATQGEVSQNKLKELLSIPQSSTSRGLAALSEWQAYQKPGLGLITMKEDPEDRRRKLVTLTYKGDKVVTEFLNKLEGA